MGFGKVIERRKERCKRLFERKCVTVEQKQGEGDTLSYREPVKRVGLIS